MLKSVKDAFKIKDLRNVILFTLLMMALTRLGSQIPVPGIDASYFKQWFAENAGGSLNFLSAFTGGSFEKFSIFGLGITPYITASIMIQLLTIAIPALEEMRKDGDYGQKKIDKITIAVGVGLALLESAAMAIGFGRSGLLPNMNVLRGLLVVVCMTGGAGLMILMGKAIDKKGVGNGISIVLLTNILAGIPQDFATLFEMFVKGKTPAKGLLAAAVILAVTLGTVVLVILLNEAYRRIPTQYAQKSGAGRRMVGASRTNLPIKLNVANVMPVIFASSLFSVPQMISSFVGSKGTGPVAFFLNCLNQGNWFDVSKPAYTVGYLLYAVLIVGFAYFYVSISFNPMEIADSLKKQGATIPGVRQGKPTEAYLSKIVGRITFLGAVSLLVVVTIPILCSGLFGASVSFGGTSIIIIVGVVLETMEQIGAKMQVRNYKSFLAA